jgi:hypothetical protein
MASLTLKNRHLVGLCTWLQGLSLAGKESRERTRFVAICIPRIEEVERLKNDLGTRYCAKNQKDGSLELLDIDGRKHWSIPTEKQADFRKEHDELENEDFLIDLLEGNIAKVKTVRDLVLNTDFKFGPAEDDSEDERAAKVRLAKDYEEWCVAFEALTV